MNRVFYIVLFCSVAIVPAAVEAGKDINCETTTCEKTYKIKSGEKYDIRGRCYKDGEYDHIPTSMRCDRSANIVGCNHKTKDSANKPYLECICENDDLSGGSHHVDVTVHCD